MYICFQKNVFTKFYTRIQKIQSFCISVVLYTKLSVNMKRSGTTIEMRIFVRGKRFCCCCKWLTGLRFFFLLHNYFELNRVVSVNVVSMTKSDKMSEKPTHTCCSPSGMVPSCMSCLYNPIGF